MLRTTLISAIAASLSLTSAPVAPAASAPASVAPAVVAPAVVAPATNAATALKWPPWLSIESPVNPFDRANHGAVLLVHAMMHDRTPAASDLSASAEGIVNGQRRTIALRLDATPQPGVFALRQQWPGQGAWLLRITLSGNTTALVTLGADNTVASVRVPTRMTSDMPLPRAVSAREVDSVLTVLAASQR
ncbi:MAG TPA: hypothetical protein VN677_15565 [Gemmatimonadaceae bacterium]|jgi:hypothetical protein|nr:hypothetical protein [Gemmatimonadaceae bacterium]